MTLTRPPQIAKRPSHHRRWSGRRLSVRTLVLVDVENLTVGTHFTAADVAATRVAVQAIASVPADAHVVVATSCGTTLVTAGVGWPGARLVWLPGPDGADLALADVALNEDVADRFDRVVIGSGDGLFAVVACFLTTRGLGVTVVARHRSLSRKLAAAVPDVRVIGIPDPTTLTRTIMPSQRPGTAMSVTDQGPVTPLTILRPQTARSPLERSLL